MVRICAGRSRRRLHATQNVAGDSRFLDPDQSPHAVLHDGGPMDVLPPCLDATCEANSFPCDACATSLMHCSVRTFTKGQNPFFQGDPQGYVYRVQSGGLSLFLNLADGRRQIVDFAFPGDFVALGTQRHFQYTAQAFAATELRCIPKGELRRRASGDARIASMLYETTAFKLEQAYDHILTTGQRNSEGKLAAFLLAMSRRNVHLGEDPTLIHLPMRRSDIADYLGVTGETISRQFTRFKTRRWIKVVDVRHVRLLDQQQLTRFANAVAMPIGRSFQTLAQERVADRPHP